MDKGLFNPRELVEITGGRILGPEEPWGLASHFFIDSRKIPAHGVFVSLKGERTDGHLFLSDVLSKGCHCALAGEYQIDLIEKIVRTNPEASILVVKDTLDALGSLARFHLDRFPNTLRIGVSGSNGKTTTKEMIAGILAKKGPTYATEGNLNSEIGLPLTVLGLNDGYDFAVLEMGINHPGEMTFLAKIARPSISVITNVGTAHIGILGSQKGIALEKKEIFMHSGSGARAVLPGDDPFLAEMKKNFSGSVKTFSLRDSQVAILENRGLDGTVFQWKGVKIHLPLPGLHNVKNALAALEVGEMAGVNPADMKSALEGMKPLFGRSEILRGAVTVLQDCYNANFDSMIGLVDTADQTPWEGNKVFVLGSMKELGDEAPRFHRDLGRRCAKLDAAGVFFYGDEAREAYQACKEGKFPGYLFWSEDFDELSTEVLGFLKKGDLAILKGSRSTQLERLTPMIMNSFSP